MSHLQIIWEDDAMKLLEGRDRFTRNTIREEFRRDPSGGAIEFDPGQRSYLTPVDDGRFSVIWRLDESGTFAIVRAIVPLVNVTLDEARLKRPEALDELRDYIRRAVKTESKGNILV